MTIFSPIVQPPAHLAAVLVAEFLHRCGVGSEAVGDDLLGFPVPLQRLLQECQGRGFVSLLGDIGFEDWPAAGLMDTEIRCFIELEVQHGTTEVYARV